MRSFCKFFYSTTNKQIILKNQQNRVTMFMPQHKYSLIWLSGLGFDASNTQKIFMNSASPLYHQAKIRLLSAPQRYVSVYSRKTNSWYDIKSFSRDVISNQQNYSIQQINQSFNIIEEEVRKEVQYWKAKQINSSIDPYQRIFIGGFSQGCAMSLYYGLQCQQPLKGIIGYSGHFFKSIKLTNIQKTNILLFHGSRDKLFYEEDIRQQYKQLIAHKNTSYTKIEKLKHEACLYELQQTIKWLSKLTSDLITR